MGPEGFVWLNALFSGVGDQFHDFLLGVFYHFSFLATGVYRGEHGLEKEIDFDIYRCQCFSEQGVVFFAKLAGAIQYAGGFGESGFDGAADH